MASPETQARLGAEQSDRQADQEILEIDLVELLYRLLEKAKYIILAAILGALIAGVYTFQFVTPMYTATSKLYVINANSAAIDLSALQIGTQLASDYKEVFSNWHVHERVIQKLDLPYSYRDLGKMISVSNPQSTRILYIRAQSASPDEAKLLADTYAQVAQEFIAETMSTSRPNIFEEALRPTAPSSPNKTRNIIIGFLLGAVLAMAIVVIQFITDDRIHTEEDITKHLDLPVLGMMPSQSAAKGKQKTKSSASARSARKGKKS